jgi:hypothetical protein
MTAPIEFLITGPQIMKTKVSMDLVDLLLKKGEESVQKNLSWSDKRLMRCIKKAFWYEDLDNWFAPLIQPHISDYINWSIERDCALMLSGISELPSSLNTKVTDLWINYQQKNEYIVPHIHSASLSFVIWLEIPEELKNEPLLSSTFTPGAFNISYGEAQSFSRFQASFLPEIADMLIFPAYCEHYVHQFKSDVTRISVSGNVQIDVPEHQTIK